MPTTNTNFTSLITAIDTKAQSLAASTTDPKDLVFLGKAVEALNVADTVSAVITEGDTQVAAVAAQGTTSIAAVAAQGSGYASLANPTFTGTVNAADVVVSGDLNAADLVLSGDLTVNGTTTTINATTLDVADINITIADGAANSAAADGAGLTIEGAGVNFQYSDSGKHMSLNTGLKIQAVKEKWTNINTTSGAVEMNLAEGAVVYLTTGAAANRTINFRGDATTTLDSIMAVGESMTCAVLFSNGSTPYRLTGFTIDGASQSNFRWQGGAPTEGNASGIDTYSFTIFKSSPAGFSVIASLAAFE
tara:strand:+ start:436 stop:1353 length:918 start_codon:yes stop_codon:yes gene_type:complete